MNHYNFMLSALECAEDALKDNEVPVAAVIVHNNKIIAKGYNQTNKTLNGTMHAEFECFNNLKSNYPKSFNKLIKNSDLYVTVEPCIMCASFLKQIGIRKVFFGCCNERFGGNGSVFRINLENTPSDYKVYPGICAKEAISLLRKFYIMENENSPNSIGKKQRKLELNSFPKLIYSNYLTIKDFKELWGDEFEWIYNENDFLEFNIDGELINKKNDYKRKKLI